MEKYTHRMSPWTLAGSKGGTVAAMFDDQLRRRLSLQHGGELVGGKHTWLDMLTVPFVPLLLYYLIPRSASLSRNVCSSQTKRNISPRQHSASRANRSHPIAKTYTGGPCPWA